MKTSLLKKKKNGLQIFSNETFVWMCAKGIPQDVENSLLGRTAREATLVSTLDEEDQLSTQQI